LPNNNGPLELADDAGGETKLPPYLAQALQTCRTLPSIPGVVLEVLDLSQDPDIGTAEIARVLSRDPALVAKILKVANSAWIGVRREVTTLGQAVNLLGTNGTMSLALSFSLVRGLRKVGVQEFDHQAYWKRSAISATATLSVGTYIGAAKPDELFLSGLLQDIGMLVLNEALPDYGRLIILSKGDHESLVEIEQRELGTDHGRVSSWFLDKCGLPKRLISPIPTSHQDKGIRNPLAKSVAVGSRIAEIWANPNTAAAMASATKAVRNLLELSDPRFDEILGKIASKLPEITRNLEIPIGDENFINRLLDQAREAMAELNMRALQEARQLAVQAQKDSLTSLHNRSYLDHVLELHCTLSRKLTQPLTAIFIDIDNFKKINDSHGHRCGDSVLVSVARVIQSATREDDTTMRYGGDEFVVLLSKADEHFAAQISERIRLMVEQQSYVAGDGTRIPVTVSVGWATMSSNSKIQNAAELLEVADRSLYLAKTSGRNRVAGAV
jgi:diguanylate cyclase (GGDEF)-like protein